MRAAPSCTPSAVSRSLTRRPCIDLRRRNRASARPIEVWRSVRSRDRSGPGPRADAAVRRYVHATMRTADLLGATRLALDATAGLTAVVESMHGTIARGPLLSTPAAELRTSGLTGFVYRCVRGTTLALGGAIDLALGAAGTAGVAPSSARREALVAALNGVVGDHLAATGNPLAIPMRLRRRGRPLELSTRALASAFRRPSRKVLVLVHGACRGDLQWRRLGHDHGAALSRALGYDALYLHYNTGLHVSENGRAFAALLERLVEAWPVALDELAIVGHSMGGLVARSACHEATASGHRWLGRLRRLRSAGVTDLRFGSVHDEDWRGRERFGDLRDRRRLVPLPPGVRCYAIAAARVSDRGAFGRLLGDGLVTVDSALGRHPDPLFALAIPEERQWVAQGADHFALLSRQDVYARLR